MLLPRVSWQSEDDANSANGDRCVTFVDHGRWWSGRGCGCGPRRRLCLIHDLQFRDFMADPIASVKKIYSHFDQQLSDDGEKALRAWHEAHPQGKHGKHSYDKQEIGVVEEEILERFSAYIQRYDLAGEA